MRKDMGELHTGELVPPTRTGKRAVVEMQVTVFVEVAESDDWRDMTDQAKDELNKRVVESNTFYPVGARAIKVTTNQKVQTLKHQTFVDERGQW